jgi:hypothetical protein
MKLKSLYDVILKIFGLFFLKDIIDTIPLLFSSVLGYIEGNNHDSGGLIVLILISTLLYGYITYLFVFKTNDILKKLKLDSGLNHNNTILEDEAENEQLSFDVPTSLVLTISFFVIAGVILLDQIPTVFRQLFLFYKEAKLSVKSDYSLIIFSVVKIVLALLLIGERKAIINFIENRQQKNVETENE